MIVLLGLLVLGFLRLSMLGLLMVEGAVFADVATVATVVVAVAAPQPSRACN